ncbi:unnamed protein product [Aphanomyces euteiches]|uniref:Long-chain-fatty-acid--CoA ligase n=1 Tax=Aphanomyces euteiches TaxID=100861 RepID=A0A6G0XNH5_9STRA|nr:hypothetical protein Ae201684_003054 [Aphanomyces euteiches]KAH9098792.1 hypothetical protein Ae201684P_018002 [Aphanomyces euteiches]KAH9143845.1 hypothetical protein AeRB84_012187 [Aphanomyces euteiches]
MLTSFTPAVLIAAIVVLGLAVVIYVLFFKPTNYIAMPKSFSQADPSTIKPGHGAAHRVGSFPKSPVDTLYQLFERAVKKNPDGNFLGHRPLDAQGNAGPYVWETYAQVHARIQHLASGIIHENIVPPNKSGERMLCIYMKNRPEWVLVQYTMWYLGGCISSLYDSLGATSTAFILNQTESPAVICTSSEFLQVVKTKPLVSTLKHVIVVDIADKSQEELDAATSVGLKLWTLFELEAIGAKHLAPPLPARNSDTSILMYTSGTTGDPKGVKITHNNILVCIMGIEGRLNRGKSSGLFQPNATHLSYLPLPHIFEQLVHAIMISNAAGIGFFQGDTRKLMEDLKTLRPTVFSTVPRLLNRMYDKVIQGGKSKGGLSAWLFDIALKTKLANLKAGYLSHPLYDRLIFKNIQRQLGLDKCSVVISGSAPLSEDVMSFFRVILDCPVFEGYGQSECTGAVTITDVNDLTVGTVGAPLACAEIKLISVPEMGYEVTDTTHGDNPSARIPVNGRGEICYRGPSIFPGYYNAPDKTAEALDEEGWLHSGDIGVWTLDGRLKVVDRKKNIFKLSQGEYVAPEKIENVIKASEYVAQPFVYGDSLHSLLVAIIVPNEKKLLELGETLGVAGSFAELCEDAKVVDAVLKDITAAAKAGKLHGFEIPRAIFLTPEPFTIENDMLTPTFKLKRNDAKKKFQAHIDDLYVKSGDAVAGKQVKQG